MTNEELMKVVDGFSQRLKDAIDRVGTNQKELADECGISQANISRYLKGKRLPGSKNLVKMANVLGTTPDHLLLGITTAHDIVREQLLRKIGKLIGVEQDDRKI